MQLRRSFSVRVRYAPSPTGWMHLGGLRTALYNFLFATKSGGEFFVRIEDTDQTRLVSGSEEAITRVLEWAGIRSCETPQRQSDRLDIYRQHCDELLDKKAAYRCFCTKERLEGLRQSAQSMYPRFCLYQSEADEKAKLRDNLPFTVRLRVPEGSTTVQDMVRGRVVFDHRQVDDQVLLKSDGFPTYHLANVVDDHLMRVSHVIRGEEWLPSTAKHIILYKAFGWEMPKFAHLPLLLSDQGGKLSKRHDDAAVESFIEAGYLPEALVNFVAFLGWSPPEGVDEVMSMAQLAEHFSLERVHKGGAAVSRRKLDWLNSQHLQKALKNPESRERVIEQFLPYISAFTNDRQYAALVLDTIASRLSVFSEIASKCDYFFKDPDWTSERVQQYKAKVWNNDKSPAIVKTATEALTAVQNWSVEEIAAALKATGIKQNDIFQTLRLQVTGTEVGASVPETLHCLGRGKTMQRLAQNKT